MIQAILQKAFQFLSSSLTDFNTSELMDGAMREGQSQTTGAVMNMLEGYARSKGCESAFQNNQIWSTLRSKAPNEVIPYAQKMIKEMGLMNIIGSFLGKK